MVATSTDAEAETPLPSGTDAEISEFKQNYQKVGIQVV